MRVIEQLLGLQASDPNSSLDETQIGRIQYLLRSSGGEHGAVLAEKLGEEVAAPPPPPPPAPTP